MEYKTIIPVNEAFSKCGTKHNESFDEVNVHERNEY